MLVLLPPSETKRAGGDGPALDLAALSYSELAQQREVVLNRLTALTDDPAAMMRALKLGARQGGEVEVNRALRTSPTRRALERYTGVLYDALDASSLSVDALRRASTGVAIHSALFGLIAADDRIPAYRLSATSRLPGMPLAGVWREGVRRLLDGGRFVLDLRSEAYAALGPVPDGVPHLILRLVTEDDGGTVRALNHFNKRAKGLFLRELLHAPAWPSTQDDLLGWARVAGWRIAPTGPGRADVIAPVRALSPAPRR